MCFIPVSSQAHPETVEQVTFIQESATYVCPPCGCSGDEELFSKPGCCVHCGMKLIEAPQGLRSDMMHFFAPLFRNTDTSTLYYSKFLYPAFFGGLILSIFMLLNARGRKSNIYLILLLTVIALYGFKHQLYGVGYELTNNPNLIFLPISFITLIGPLLYFHTQNITLRNFRPKQHYLHFAPAAVFFGLYLLAFLLPTPLKDSLRLSRFEPIFSHAEQFIAIISGLIYLHLSSKLIENHLPKGETESVAYFESKWLRKLVPAFIGFFVIWFTIWLANWQLYEFRVTTITYYPLWLSAAGILYWLGYEIMFRSQEFLYGSTAKSTKSTKSIHTRRLAPQTIANLKVKLLELMKEEKPYLNPGLNLSELSRFLNINPKDLSVVINEGLGRNFYDFINEYRLEEVKAQLVNPENSNLTNEAIAYEAGFNSKSTFNALFKKHVKMTPKDFKRSHALIES